MSQDHDLFVSRLQIARADLLEGLRSLARTTEPANAGQAILSFTDGQLEIAIGGGAVTVDASGRWPGECRVPGGWVLALHAHPPAVDPVTLTVEGGRLHVETMSVGCHWQKAGSAQVVIPIGAGLRDLLAIALDYDDQVLEASGILKQIRDARELRRQIVVNAVDAFAPLHIPEATIEAFIDHYVRRGKPQA